MSLNIQCISYDDFKLVVNSLPDKVGNVYYKFTVGGGFFVVALSVELSFAVGGSQSTLPTSFATDFPNAIQLTDTAPTTLSNFLVN